MTRAVAVTRPDDAGVPVSAPSAAAGAADSASGSVPSESRTLGTWRRRSSSAYDCRPSSASPAGRAGESRARLHEIEEENVVGPDEGATLDQRRADRGELSPHRGKPNDQVVLGQFPQSGQRASASESEADDTGAKPAANARTGHQRLDHPRRFRGAAREHGVGRTIWIFEPQVVRQHAQDVARVVGPPRHADVDFRHGAMAPALEELAEAALGNRRQRPGAELGGERVRRALAHDGRGAAVGPDAARERPQLEVHFGRDVVRQATEDRQQILAARRLPKGLGRKPEHRETDGGTRPGAREHRDNRGEQGALDEVQALRCGRVLRHGQRGGEVGADPLGRPVRAFRADERSHRGHRHLVADSDAQHAPCERQDRPVGRSETQIGGQLPQYHRRARFHHVEHARHQIAADAAPEHTVNR